MSRTRRNRHPYKRPLYALHTRLQAAFHGQTCDICAMPLHRKLYFTDLYTVLCRACFVKEIHMPVTTSDLTAFCDVCPAADEVTAALAPLGFTLAFQMKEDHQHSYLAIAPLPAQFHYQDAHGTEVIYLEGSDAYLGDEDEMDRGAFPPHASRFWLYAGSNVSAYEQTTQALTATWALPWVPLNAIPVEHLPALDSAA